MKKTKKIFTIALSGLFLLGAVSQATVNVEAFSPDVIHKVNGVDGMNGYEQEAPKVYWEQPIRLKLRARHNSLYKDWWEIKLICEDGILKLVGKTDIPRNLMFDDIFIIGFNDASRNGRTRHIFKTYDEAYPDVVLREQMQRFNDARITADQGIFMHGQYWDGTLRFGNGGAIYSGDYKTNNDYSQGYRSIDKWRHGFFATKQGLRETIFIHNMYPTGDYS